MSNHRCDSIVIFLSSLSFFFFLSFSRWKTVDELLRKISLLSRVLDWYKFFGELNCQRIVPACQARRIVLIISKRDACAHALVSLVYVYLHHFKLYIRKSRNKRSTTHNQLRPAFEFMAHEPICTCTKDTCIPNNLNLRVTVSH